MKNSSHINSKKNEYVKAHNIVLYKHKDHTFLYNFHNNILYNNLSNDVKKEYLMKTPCVIFNNMFAFSDLILETALPFKNIHDVGIVCELISLLQTYMPEYIITNFSKEYTLKKILKLYFLKDNCGLSHFTKSYKKILLYKYNQIFNHVISVSDFDVLCLLDEINKISADVEKKLGYFKITPSELDNMSHSVWGLHTLLLDLPQDIFFNIGQLKNDPTLLTLYTYPKRVIQLFNDYFFTKKVKNCLDKGRKCSIYYYQDIKICQSIKPLDIRVHEFLKVLYKDKYPEYLKTKYDAFLHVPILKRKEILNQFYGTFL